MSFLINPYPDTSWESSHLKEEIREQQNALYLNQMQLGAINQKYTVLLKKETLLLERIERARENLKSYSPILTASDSDVDNASRLLFLKSGSDTELLFAYTAIQLAQSIISDDSDSLKKIKKDQEALFLKRLLLKKSRMQPMLDLKNFML